MPSEVTAKTVTAERFRLVNESGELRGLMKTEGNDPVLQFMDEDSNIRLDLQVTNNWPVINMKDESGNVRVELGSMNGHCSLFLRDRDGDLRLGIALSGGDGSPRILFFDDKQQVRFGVVSDTEGTPRVIGADQFGKRHKLMWFAEQQAERDDRSKAQD